MTLILGVNLSNRIYLSADSRITFSDGSFADNVIKVMPLYGNNILGFDYRGEGFISLAVAGNIRFCSFLSTEIYDALRKKSLSGNVRVLYEQIDNFIKLKVDKWLSAGGEFSEACLLFGGMIFSKNKIIDQDKFKSLVDLYGKSARSDYPDIAVLVEEMRKNEITQQIETKIMKDTGKSITELLEYGRKPIVPEHLKALIENRDGKLTDCMDSLLFAIKINTKSPSYEKEKAEWGEFLAYGSGGINQNDLPDDILAQLEFWPGQQVTKNDLIEAVILGKSIETIAQDFGEIKIGGTIFTNVIRNNGSSIFSDGSRVKLVGTKLCIKMEDGKYIEMKGFNKYSISSEASL